MDNKDDETSATPTPIEQLTFRLTLCEAEVRAQNAMIRALIACHSHPDLLEEAFARCCERGISNALQSPSSDASIFAFEHFQSAWEEFLHPLAQAARDRPRS
ncbi:hypothetical protein DR64_772 [Paraburkholderia xenovorans LB400]|uniref:Uncharacterized protein n=1 Tax=Paraburkholderia xenovorans (strain LB400) TaxID=266265 RepID=Q141U6_PARXL|nr:hypothetical protein [Paraburkholderia xenovorans]ABE29893.1 hypothetical protein Bxe_A3086 [Paraburkholderia xenovorans LB400]AIP33240.1 hypothetical protein DR64_772 [Paraburkholderia xenovorans LB400]